MSRLHQTLPQHLTPGSPYQRRQAMESSLPLTPIKAYSSSYLNSQVQSLLKKLHQRDQELLELRAQKEKLEEETQVLKDMLSKERQNSVVLHEEVKSKENQVQFYRDQMSGRSFFESQDYTDLVKQLKDIENTQTNVLWENCKLREQIENTDFPALAVGREVGKTCTVGREVRLLVDSYIQRKPLNFGLVMGKEATQGSSSPDQMEFDLKLLREDLIHIKTIVADLHADECGKSECLTQ